MIDKIKNKVKDNPPCELSINELIELSKIDYNELVDIFGKNYVAQSPDEITVETICYVGNLNIDEEFPTYNLRYVFGDFRYHLDKIYHLEGLQFVSGKMEFTKTEDLSDLSEMVDNVEYMMYATMQNGIALKYTSSELKNNKEIVLKTIKLYGWALEHASDELKGDKEVVLAAVKQNGLALAYASEELQKDKEIVLNAVKDNGLALAYASHELKK